MKMEIYSRRPLDAIVSFIFHFIRERSRACGRGDG